MYVAMPKTKPTIYCKNFLFSNIIIYLCGIEKSNDETI